MLVLSFFVCFSLKSIDIYFYLSPFFNLIGKPKSPLIVCVVCKSTSATVVWLQDFNGGQLQSFRIVYWDNERKFGTEMSDEIAENDSYRENIHTVNDLKPHTKYTFFVLSANDFGSSRSKVIECSTDERKYATFMIEL